MNAPSFSDVILRILAAAVAGGIIGMERESHGRAAGLRTSILACVASALAMILSEFLFVQGGAATAGGNWRPDPARLGAGILTGIGFLGAGTIIRNDNMIRGVTTAASLWFVTVLGLAIGCGHFDLAAAGFAVAIIALVLLPKVEAYIPSDWYSTLTVTSELDGLAPEELKQKLESIGLEVKAMTLHYDLTASEKTISCQLKLLRRSMSALSMRALEMLRQCPGVRQIKWH